MSNKYRFLDYDSTYDILKIFFRGCRTELIKGNIVRINRIGKFYVDKKPQKVSTTIFRKKRIVPEMNVVKFKTSNLFRDFINEWERNK